MNYRQPFEGDYPITQRFGEKITSKFHTGIDFGCPLNTRILASESGQVFFSGWKDGGYGYCVFIVHPDGNVTIYEHLLSQIPVAVSDKVQKGQLIGYSGSTGNSTGAHLHFEVRDKDGKAFDPMTILHSIDDTVNPISKPKNLKGADALNPDVEVVAPLGVWGWSPNFDKRQTVYPYGTKLHFTGRTTKHNEYTYCECYPEPAKYWVAVNDGDCQILDNVSTDQS